ncbi:MAG: hypothetical protein KDD45_03370 [Bdellovibrionales bacterium]|nr:hypothetical protein [Bdellovibrionales bacterium]
MKVDKILLVFLMSITAWGQSTSTLQTPNKMTTSTSAVKPAEEKPFTYNGNIRITTMGRNIHDEDLKSTVGWSLVSFNLESKYYEWLIFNASLLGVFGEGAAQNYLNKEGAGANLFVADAIYLTVKPIEQLSMQFGLTEYKLNPLMTVMSSATSLGSVQDLTFKNSSESVKVSFIGNEAIPSTGLSQGVVEKDKTPFFLAGSVKAELKVSPIKSTIKAAATKFKFGNLPKGEAEKALIDGNSQSSVVGVGDNMQFAIGFAGTETAGIFETEWTKNFKTTLKASVINNDEAYDGLNQGKLGGLSMKYTKGNYSFSPSLTVFDVQPDVTPAPYSVIAGRYNNRKGYKVNLGFDLEKQKLGFFAGYTKMEELFSSPYLYDREIYNLGVEVQYDLF